jgi:outer membrane protein assembly factor BamD
MRRLLLAAWLAAAGLAALGACENEPPKTALGYTENAKREYDAALEQFKAHQWLESQTAMHEVKRKYSYSKYARMAELRIADADYEQEKYVEAIRGYKDFIHAHRTDEEDVVYARSRIADAMNAEIPESFLMPASEERDQAAVVDAYKELKSFLADYPGATQSAHARELLGTVIARLIRHELYVARFYLGKGNYDAAIARIQYALHNYGDGAVAAALAADGGAPASSLEADALLLLGETYLKMHKWVDARQSFESILQHHARSAVADQARNYLAHLKELGV